MMEEENDFFSVSTVDARKNHGLSFGREDLNWHSDLGLKRQARKA